MSTSPIYLTEADVSRLVTVKDAIATLEALFATWGQPSTSNLPRQRARLAGGAFNLMGAAYGAKGVHGLKAYAGLKGAQFHTLLYSSLDGRLKAMIEADLFGQMRTGAASGLATKLLANPDARHARRHRHRAAIADAGHRRLRGAADQARQGVRPHSRASRELCARDGKGARRRGAAGAVGASLRCRRRRRGHHHQVGRAGVPGGLARERRARQRRRRQFRRPPRGRRRDRVARRREGDRSRRAGQGGGGRVSRPGRGRQARLVRRSASSASSSPARPRAAPRRPT